MSENNLEDIKLLLLKIDSRLDNIEIRLDQVEISTGNMDSHIDFVEMIYENIRSPFHRLMNIVSYQTIEMTPEQKYIEDQN